MGLFGRALASGVAVKAARFVKREASKPQNQRKARKFVGRLRNRRSR